METLDHTFKSRSYASYAYEYDRLGNRTRAAEYLLQPEPPPIGPYTIYLPSIAMISEIDPRTYVDYDYDPLYRLTAADYNTGEYFHYTYDAVGNRLEEETHDASSSYEYDTAHRIDNVDGVAYSWDANGNLLSDGERTFTYDHADRLNSVSNQPSAFSFGYDGLGNRYQQTLDATTTFSLDLAAGLTQVLSDGSNTHFYGLGRIGSDASGGWGYHLGDALGSLRQLTDASAEVTFAQSFEPFGAPLSSSGAATSEFGFAGEQDDITGLVFLRARYYDPGTGRFITKDPFSGFTTSPATLHPYTYALNNPTNLVDPSGQNPLLILAAVSFLAGVGVNTWMQYQANNGWCGFDPLTALQSGVSAAVLATLVVFTGIEFFALAGMGLQGIGVLFTWLPAFSAGVNLSAVAGAAAVWFITGQRIWQSKPTGLFYSVAHERSLDSSDYGTSHGTHVRRATASLTKMMGADPEFANSMEELIPGINRALDIGRVPPGWTWHHAVDPGIMQLVPVEQHTAGSIFWDTLHPGGVGGYNIWARPAGAPKR